MNPPPQLDPLPERYALRASWILPIETPPIRDGELLVNGGVIESVGRRRAGVVPSECVFDLGHVAILPGLVNAHTHLEFSALSKPLGRPGMSLPDWIREVVAWRVAGTVGTTAAEVNAAGKAADGSRSEPAKLGIDESLRHGVTTLGEIATRHWSAHPWQVPPLNLVVFRELLGLLQDRQRKSEEAMHEHAQAAREAVGQWLGGLSPHAPYSVHPATLRAAVALSTRQRLPLAMHLAESREELELLRSGGGPFRKLLDDMSAWEPGALPTGAVPLDYLKTLAGGHRSLVIHGNYLDEQEIEFLAAHRDTLSLVYCPRTHAYFDHEPFPLARLLAAGVRVALGTDSRASNPDLDLLAEMRFVAKHHGLPPDAILRMGTLAGAEALGLEDSGGSLAAGKRAAFCLVELPARTGDGEPDCDIASVLLHGSNPAARALLDPSAFTTAPPR